MSKKTRTHNTRCCRKYKRMLKEFNKACIITKAATDILRKTNNKAREAHKEFMKIRNLEYD